MYAEHKDPLWESYWLALGRFVHAFTETEGILFGFLMAAARINPATATAIFSGTRVTEGMSFVRRTLDANNLPVPESLSRAFEQLALINRCRNDILHHGAQLSEGELKVSTALRSMPNRDRAIPISPELLDAMTADLRVIQWNMILLSKHAAAKQLKAPSHEASPDEWRYALSPWRYKHRELPRSRQASAGGGDS